MKHLPKGGKPREVLADCCGNALPVSPCLVHAPASSSAS